MTTLNVRAIENLADSDLRRPTWSRNTQDQVVIYLTEDGVLGYRGDFGNHATPADEWHRRTVTWEIKPDLRAAPVREMILEHMELFERVRAGHSVIWNDRNMVGRLNEDAQAAEREIEALLADLGSGEDDEISYHDASYWFCGVKEMFTDLDDNELEALVEREVHDGKPFYAGDRWVVIDVDDALDYARKVRDAYAAEVAEDE